MACIVKHVRSKCSAKRLDPACYDSKPVISDINKLFDNCVEKYGEIQERVLVINNSTDSSGSSIMVKAECAEVSVYVAFNKRHPTENDCDDKTFATDGSPGKLDVVKNTKRDQLSVTIRSRRRYGLKSISCHHPSYTVSIKPKDHMFEVACHLKRDERPCSDEEKRDKCKDDPRNPPSAGYRQLSINAWISTGLLVAWRLA
ncbi:uncharacterized protein LOC115229615 [Octopus sinensis]|uniref:Uncharacterized protein LOC115229615 n=1 Tax=Octopus sinensis TaxID=2607531 RepID=A0A6P7TVK2_9MOLL|nr:uncharacterized protein LOC115229615 [Octopus sinensis]